MFKKTISNARKAHLINLPEQKITPEMLEKKRLRVAKLRGQIKREEARPQAVITNRNWLRSFDYLTPECTSSDTVVSPKESDFELRRVVQTFLTAVVLANKNDEALAKKVETVERLIKKFVLNKIDPLNHMPLTLAEIQHVKRLTYWELHMEPIFTNQEIKSTPPKPYTQEELARTSFWACSAEAINPKKETHENGEPDFYNEEIKLVKPSDKPITHLHTSCLG